jgi:hypothetical protein
MMLRLRSWLNTHIALLHTRPDVQESIQRSQEFTEAKCRMVRLTQDIEAGHGPKIIRLRQNVWEEALGREMRDDE